MTRPPLDEFLAQATPIMGRPPQALTDIATDMTVRPIWDMAQGLGAAVSGNIGVPEVGTGLLSTLGIFAGPGARTANRGALRLAEEMERRGFSREQIWDATGWFKGADKGWRFEIPDNGLDVTWGRGQGLDSRAPASHPELSKAYPHEARNVVVNTEFSPATEGGFGSQNGKTPYITMGAPHESALRSGVAHELQHMVQTAEGFARGGTPEAIEERLPQNILRNLPLEQRNDILQRAYERLAGEVEARNVQTRLPLTPEQRRRSYPWTTEDTPPEHQIVAGVRLTPVNHDPFK